MTAAQLAENVRMLVLDVDGVLTDGRLYYGNAGEELKAFNIKDGLGIKLLQRAGIPVAIITGRTSDSVLRRAGELGIDHLVQGREDKLTALHELCQQCGLSPADCAYMGDDLPDLAAIAAAGLGMTVADGSGAVRAAAVGLAELDAAGTDADRELRRNGPSYTIDSVKYFKSNLPEKSQIYLVMGLDAFLEIDSWKSYEELLQQVSIIVINRPKKNRLFSGDGWKRLDEYLTSGILGGDKFSESQSCYLSAYKQPIFIFEVTALDISSTKIRSLIKEGRSIGYLVPRKTAKFINSRGLYL